MVVRAVLRPVRRLAVHGRYDGAARTLFPAWQVYAPAHGATRLLWLFFAVEATFGLVQLAPWWRSRHTAPEPGETGPADGLSRTPVT